MGMQCAHVFGRKHGNVRCYPDNAICLCASCHAVFTDAPTEWGLFVIAQLGEGAYQLLLDRKNNLSIKYNKAAKAEMAKHYRDEYTRVQKLRAKGADGYIRLVSYD